MNLNPLEIGLILLLAIYRWTQMLNNEAGPAHIFERLRTRAGVRMDKYSNPYGTNWIAEGILCFYCLSVWVATFFVVATLIAAFMGVLEAFLIVLLPFALSGGAVYLKKVAG